MFDRKRVRIHGIVQGVGFRAAAARRAQELGVAGWVHNAPDGSVEVEVTGTPETVEKMLSWLGHGPESARVDSVRVVDDATLASAPAENEFRIA